MDPAETHWRVGRITARPPRRRDHTRQDLRIEPIDQMRPLPTSPATCTVEAVSAREVATTVEESPHERQNRKKMPFMLTVMLVIQSGKKSI